MINFQSILAKKAEFSLFTNEQQPDIIFGTETWLLPEIKSTEFFPPDYSVIRHDRKDGYGGVLLGFRNGLNIIEYPLTTDCDIISCKLVLSNNQSVVLCSVYRPPNSTLQYLEEVTANLNTIIVNNPDTPIWIAGDFNLPNIKWSNGTISGYNYPRAFGELLLDFSNDHGLIQMVDTPTRGNNILDLFFY